MRSQHVPAQSIGSILWFDPRREHSSVPTAKSLGRPRAGPVKAGRVLSRPPEGLGLDWPEHGGILDRIGAAGVATWLIRASRTSDGVVIGRRRSTPTKFRPLTLTGMDPGVLTGMDPPQAA